LADGQKLIYKQCYSRPLYNTYNKRSQELMTEDYAWLTEKKTETDFAKDIVSQLLHKITDLEHKVTGDVRTDMFSKMPGGPGMDSETDGRSAAGFDRQSSIASFRPKVGRDVLSKLKKAKGRKARF